MDQVHRAIHEAVLEAGPKQLAHLMGSLKANPCTAPASSQLSTVSLPARTRSCVRVFRRPEPR